MPEPRRSWFHSPADPAAPSERQTPPGSQPPPPSASIADFLASVSLAPRQSHKLLTLWPLLRAEAAPVGPPWLTLADALESGALRVSERRGGAHVPVIQVENLGETPVLVLFGEELRGALQNRVANASFLIGGRSAVEIDVSCVEQGRWSPRASRGGARDEFYAGDSVLSSAIRRKMAHKVALARERGRRFDADQLEVWHEVADRVRLSAARSQTGAYEDYLFTRARDLDEAAHAFRPLPGQVGFVAAIGDEVAGLEAIGREEVFARSFERLLRAYLIDAVDAAHLRGREAQAAVRFEAPEPFLEALAAAPASERPSLGLGRDLRLRGGGVAGCALVHGPAGPAALVHLTAFAEEGA
jgi:hypothetical protein